MVLVDYLVDREALDMERGSVNQTFLLRRGWTRTAIKRILGQPDRRIAMRLFRRDRPECRYDMARVLAAEAAGPVRFRRAPNRRVPTWMEFYGGEVWAPPYGDSRICAPDAGAEADEPPMAVVVSNCRLCGVTYTRKRRGRPARYCSKLCANRAARARKH